MKKSLIALAALAAVAAAQAQESSVTFYGILDVAVGTVDKSFSVDSSFPASVNPVTQNKAPSHVYGMFNGGISGSRWGVKGVEDLGGGMKAFFTLESGINVTTGEASNAAQSLVNNSTSNVTASAASSVSGQLFSRQAFVGLSDKDLGSVQFGRNYAPIFDIAAAYDPVQAAQLFSPLGFSGTFGGGGGVTDDTRVDNSVKYGNKIGDFNFGAMYKFGGIAGGISQGSAYAVNAGYEANGLGIQVAYEQFKDAQTGSAMAKAGSAPGVKVTLEDTRAYMVAAKYAVTADINVKAGFEQYQTQAPSDPSLAAGITSYYGFAVDTVSVANATQAVNILYAGGDWNVLPQLNLAVGAYNVKYDTSLATATGLGNAGTNGDIWEASFLADYHLSKRTDTYFGYMYSKYTGPKFAGYNDTNFITAVGIRHKF